MNTRYVIRWKSKVNGRAGRGTKLFEKEDAERLVRELNEEYPEIEHELLDEQSLPNDGPKAPEREAADVIQSMPA